MENKFLEKLNDKNNRKLPLIYQYVKEETSDLKDVHDGTVYTNEKRNARTRCFKFHKPISKLG